MLTPELKARNAEFVAIGCSAGGFDALRVILPALPVGFNKSVVVVIHLSPEKESLVAKTFEGRLSLPVKEAEDKEVMEKGKVYVAPPNYHLLVEPDGSFSLSVDDPENCSRPSIDVLFDSAAHVFGEKMIGVLLTGANADGANGLREVRTCGGTAVVQDPATAQYRTMPQAGRELADPQLVMPLEDIALWLANLGRPEVTA